MASVWKLICPVHNRILKAEKTISFISDDITTNEPIFFCEDCGIYYIHTDAVPFESEFDYGTKKVINTNNIPSQDDSSAAETICTDISFLKPFSEPFIPDTCYKDKEKLEYIEHGLFMSMGIEKRVNGYYCCKCNDLYVDEDVYDEIMLALPKSETCSNNGVSCSKDNKGKYGYTIGSISNSKAKLTTENVADRLISYEKCEENFSSDYPFSLLHYAFAFRRFDAAEKILTELSEADIEEALHFKGASPFEWVTPLVCAKWNLNYIDAYDEKQKTDIYRRLEQYFSEVEHIDEVMEYTDIIDTDGHDIFDVFWNGEQPVLDIVYYEKQLLASKQVEKNGYSIVMDEVGTGKTVSALYAIRNVLQKKIVINEKAKVLVVCPYNKREDWQSDIRRQLGRYAHVVEQSDNGEMYEGNLKRVFFKKREHFIMIAGQRQGEDKNGSNSALKGSLEVFSDTDKWDLIIIDEAHLSFNNYSDLRSDRIMLLTATPIVVNAKGRRTFEDYAELAGKVLEKPLAADIDPINMPEPSEADIYVNWFREDMGQVSAERKIRFVSCKRWNERDDVFYKIKEDKGTLAALQYDQDDDYLYWAATEQYGYGNFHEVKKNGKLKCLVDILHENDRSYIIFCEHKFVADNIFSCLKDNFSDCIVAQKYGKHENQYGLGNVRDGQLINTLIQALREGRRVLFVTTGKTGGTGLNLGDFDGVIHYEIPFTSIELEQRFGRVDRIDTQKDAKTRDMIFLLNECRNDENDLEINRMLYYCTTKIDIACQFMPIRNTILFYPEFIERNGKAVREAMEWYKKEYVLSEKNEKRMKEIRRRIRQFEKNIKDSSSWHLIEDLGRNLRLSAVEALSRERSADIPDDYYELLREYLEYWKTTKPDRVIYQKMYRIFSESKKNTYNWLTIIGSVKADSNSDVFVGTESANDGDDQKIHTVSEQTAKSDQNFRTIQQQIDEMLRLIDNSLFDKEQLRDFSSEGIFCYKDGMIRRARVKQYRLGKAWK